MRQQAGNKNRNKKGNPTDAQNKKKECMNISDEYTFCRRKTLGENTTEE